MPKPDTRYATMSAGVLITGPDRSILMLETSYKADWEIPGGFVEPGESPATAVRRELLEEIGVDRRPGRLLVADWAPTDSIPDFLLLVFDGGSTTDTERAAVRFPDGEIVAARWVPATDLDTVTSTRLATRLRHALGALDDGHDRWLEHGVPV